MNRIFSEQSKHETRRQQIKWAVIISAMVLFALVTSAMLIFFRLAIGRVFSMTLGIVITSAIGIVIYQYIAMIILPQRRLRKVIERLMKAELRSLDCVFVSAAPGNITYLGLTFTILHVRPLGADNNAIVEVYFFDGTSSMRPDNYKPIRLSLSEQVVMGYESI